MKFLCLVLSIKGPNHTKSPGITTNTESNAKKIDLIKLIPISGPILNCINNIANKPPMVVRLLAVISGIDLLSAATTASLIGRLLCSSL